MTTATTPASIGKRVKKLRLDRGWTQSELADKAGITEVTVWTIEAGRVRPRDLTATAIARALDVPVDQLLGADREA